MERGRKTSDSKAEFGPLPSLYLFSITLDFPGLSPGMRGDIKDPHVCVYGLV